MTGSAGQRRVPISFLESLEIPLPALVEQRRIAAILDQADALLSRRRAALARLDDLVRSIFSSLFGELRTSGLGWPLVPVAEAGTVQLGRQRAPKYQTGKFKHPYVRVANVHEDRVDISDLLEMDFDGKDFASYSLNYGDILLNEGQSTELVGRPAMWRNEVRKCCFQNTLVRFVPRPRHVISEFALAVFLDYFRRGEFAKISAKTSSVAHLGAARFSAMTFPLPPIELQEQFVQRSAKVEFLKATHQSALSELEALFASLQHCAFRGEL